MDDEQINPDEIEEEEEFDEDGMPKKVPPIDDMDEEAEEDLM